MYCPDCNRPLAGDPDVCPNCGHQFRHEEIETPAGGKAQPVSSQSSGRESAYPGGREEAGAKPGLEKKVLFSAIALAIPVVSYFSFIIFNRFSGGVPSMGMSMVFGLLTVSGFLLVPLSLLLGILGLRSIKKSGKVLSGKSLAFLTICISSLLIVGGVVMVVIAVVNLDMARITETISERNPEIIIILIQRGIENSEKQNRVDGLQNSFGTFFPAALDRAEPHSNSGPDNPFFSAVLGAAGGIIFPGWRKGSDIYTYILIGDSSQYAYDPLDGTFQQK